MGVPAGALACKENVANRRFSGRNRSGSLILIVDEFRMWDARLYLKVAVTTAAWRLSGAGSGRVARSTIVFTHAS
jgi:hypothetical protein